MRKLLRRFLDWLDARFPVKVTVTDEEFRAWKSATQAGSNAITALSDSLSYQAERITKLEDSIKALKEAMTKPVVADAARRAAYIASGRMGE